MGLTLPHRAVLQHLVVWRRQITTSADRFPSALVALRNSRQLFEYLVETAVTMGTFFSRAFVSPLLLLLLQLSLPPLRLEAAVVAFVFFLLWWWWQQRRSLPPPPLGDRHLTEDDLSLLLSVVADFHRFQLLQQHTPYELDGNSVCVELLDTFGGAWCCFVEWSCGDSTFSFPLSSWTTTTTTAAPLPLFLMISRSKFVDFTKISVRASVAVASDSVRSASGMEPDDDSKPPQSYCCSCCRLTAGLFNSLLGSRLPSLFVDIIVDPNDPCLVNGLHWLLLLLIRSCGDDGGVGGNPLVLQCSMVVTGVAVVVTLLSVTSSAVLDEMHSESSSLVSWHLKRKRMYKISFYIILCKSHYNIIIYLRRLLVLHRQILIELNLIGRT